jgi:choline dehydrogenase-like flavoprotein
MAAGAIGSPQIMMLSGVGPADDLAKLGIPVLLDKPGVGANLHDHLQLRMIFKVTGIRTLNEMYSSLFARAKMGFDYALFRRGPLTMAPSQLGAFTRSDPSQERPNLQYHIQPLSLDKFGDPLHPFPAFTASVANLRPTSRGSLKLKSADPAAPPAIDPNYLATPEDRRVAAQSVRITRQISAQPALALFTPVEFLPGPSVRDDDEAELERAAGDIGTTIFHPVGTARMGRDDDPRAVVDARLRVMGLDGLRVIDASVMPSITSGNTNSPTLMIAEKGAAMMLEDAR